MEKSFFDRKMSKAKRLPEIAKIIMEVYRETGESWSSRGWCYILEGRGLISKGQFKKMNTWITDAIKAGFLPVDIVDNDSARLFKNIYRPEKKDYWTYITDNFRMTLDCPWMYDPDYFNNPNEKYFIQLLVEKVDLVKIFLPLCEKYLIPIGNARGWSSVRQRAEYARRFKTYQDMGKKVILLYYGDYDPDGLRIADTMYKNLYDVKDIIWRSGVTGFDPSKLIIKRVGLQKKFIEKNKLTWIDNLETGGTDKAGRPLNLASPRHKNHKYKYVQEYIAKTGVRKCEANAIVTAKDEAVTHLEKEILKILGKDVLDRRDEFKRKTQNDIQRIMNYYELPERIEAITEEICPENGPFDEE